MKDWRRGFGRAENQASNCRSLPQRGTGAQKRGQDLGCLYWGVSTEEALEAMAVSEIPKKKVPKGQTAAQD